MATRPAAGPGSRCAAGGLLADALQRPHPKQCEREAKFSRPFCAPGQSAHAQSHPGGRFAAAAPAAPPEACASDGPEPLPPRAEATWASCRSCAASPPQPSPVRAHFDPAGGVAMQRLRPCSRRRSPGASSPTIEVGDVRRSPPAHDTQESSQRRAARSDGTCSHLSQNGNGSHLSSSSSLSSS